MAISEGDRLPQVSLKVMGENGPKDITTEELFGGKKVVLFSVPGAYTPTCSAAHLPGFVVHADEIKAKGVDAIVCMAVNDVFVMDAWGKDKNAEEIIMAADGNAEFSRAMGLEFDGSAFGMGVRSQRFAMIVEDGVVTTLAVEAPGKFEVSKAESVLERL